MIGLFEAPLLAFEAEGRALAGRHAFDRLAEHYVPRAVGRTYAAGLDAIEAHLRDDPRSFRAAGENLLSYLNQWIASAERPHFDLIRTVRDPAYSLTLDSAIKFAEYATGFTLAKLLTDLAMEIGSGLVKSAPDIRKTAAYFALVGQLDTDVRIFAHDHLWPTVSGDTAFRS